MGHSKLRLCTACLRGDTARAALLSLALTIALPGLADAACNAIPAAKEKTSYLSTIGGIRQRTAAVGHRVVVDNSCFTNRAFDQKHPARNRIDLVYMGRNGKPSVARVYQEKAPAFPGCKPTADSCSAFEFTMPSFAVQGDKDLEHGLAGPSTLTVTNVGDNDDPSDPNRDDDDVIVAQIDNIYLPDKTCTDHRPDTVFGHFTALPEPNPIDLDAKDADLFAAIDVDGNLLIPFDFRGQFDDGIQIPIATLLSGLSNTKAHKTGTPDLVKPIGKRLADAQKPNERIRAFDLGGQPLPPLIRIAKDGSLFGLVDAEYSVLRIEKTDHAGMQIFELEDRVIGNAGPVKMSYDMDKDKKSPVGLAGLRSSNRTIAYVRDESNEDTDLNEDGDKLDFIAQFVSLEAGLQSKAGVEVAKQPGGNVLAPIMEVGGDYVTLLEPLFTNQAISGYKQRVYGNSGVEQANASGDDAVNSKRIDGRQLAIYDEDPNPSAKDQIAYYLRPGPDHDRFAAVRPGSGPLVTGQKPVVDAATHADTALVLVPERVPPGIDLNGDSDTFDDVAYFYTITGGNECWLNLGIAASKVAISKDIAVVAMSEYGNDKDKNGDGDKNDDVPWVWLVDDLIDDCENGATSVTAVPEITPIAADAVGALKDIAVFIAPEYAQNTPAGSHPPPCGNGAFCDLNKDGDPNDRVLLAKPWSLAVRSSYRAAEEFVLGEDFVAFRVSELAQGLEDLNGDGDKNDAVLHLFYPDCPLPSGLARLTYNTEWSAIPCTFANCDDRQPYRAIGRLVWFMTDDVQPYPAAVRAVGATSCSFIKLPWFRIPNIWPIRAVDVRLGGAYPFTPYAVSSTPIDFGGAFVMASMGAGGTLDVMGDADGDSVPDELDNCVEFPNADLLDVDEDGLGDRYCDPTPAKCDPAPIDAERCSGPTTVILDGFCAEKRDDGLVYEWNWRGRDGAPGVDPGDPIHRLPHYSLCIYSGTGRDATLLDQTAALPWPRCNPRTPEDEPCWRGSLRNGFHYVSRNRGPGRLDEMVLPSLDSDAAAAWVRGHAGKDVTPKSLQAALTVQLVVREDEQPPRCLSSMHRSARPALSECPDPERPVARRRSPRSR